MTYQRLKVFFSTFNLLLCIVGYEFTTSLFSFLMPSIAESRVITLPYHAFALFICLLTILFNIREKFSLKPVQRWFVFFFILIIIRFLYDAYYRLDVEMNSDYKFQIIMYMIPKGLLEMYAVMKSYKNISFEGLLKWVYVFFSSACIVTFFSNVEYQEATTNRLNANIAIGTISAGHLGLSTLILSIYLLLYRRIGLLKKIFVVFVVVLSTLIMLRSGSRGPILALIGVIMLWIFSVSKHRVVGLLLLLFFVLFVSLLKDVIFQLVENVSPMLYARFGYRDVGEQASDRLPLYEYAIESFLSNPIFGKNFAIYMSNGFCIYVHNILLESFMQLGLLGGVIFVVVLFKVFFRIVKMIQIKSPYFWLGLLLIQQVLKCMVSSSLYFTPIISILIILLFMPIERENCRNVFTR